MNVIVITVRCDSTRLPQKCFYKIGAISILEYQIKSLYRLGYPVIVATTNRPTDNLIETLVSQLIKEGMTNLYGYRGKYENKLDRIYEACLSTGLDIDNIYYTGADNPLVSLGLIELMFSQLKSRKLDFIDGEPSGLPIGSIVQAFTLKSLKYIVHKIEDNANDSDTNTDLHTEYFKENCNYGIFNVDKIKPDFLNKSVRLTIDYDEDYRYLLFIYRECLKKMKKNNTNKGIFIDFDLIMKVNKEQPDLCDVNSFRNLDWKKNQEEKVKQQITIC